MSKQIQNHPYCWRESL